MSQQPMKRYKQFPGQYELQVWPDGEWVKAADVDVVLAASKTHRVLCTCGQVGQVVCLDRVDKENLQHTLAAKEAALVEARRMLQIWHDSDDAIMDKHGVNTDDYIAQLEAQRDTLHAELARVRVLVDNAQASLDENPWKDWSDGKVRAFLQGLRDIFQPSRGEQG